MYSSVAKTKQYQEIFLKVKRHFKDYYYPYWNDKDGIYVLAKVV